ncbi:MAG: hypothetical protein A2381_12260 [Bdellovibrionales bacterium RIFOXYB1_FULL_37_110]|nr:MAG: hypothetical protein A2181_01980 [Bdellovibrionales bacterium RIFOXYA1_FULL_38_20]OFZ52269.1 MAG: hypothetical protein A2417_06100 [Bdellovibrionales bacterium RIFOXYC1_FULL_37_79]OFZ57256.1 MAG: hypothetical protein A2381_12260 [Bdellovibrionales bacterium RIFOXYB1_FULL_37_110]OFZ65258.1 MAG: hypothetical protein A2577_04695 [Bdellovibrionales bacterium RIFOXYD1_FULL_36_51]
MKVLMALILFIFSFSTFAVQKYKLDINLLSENKSISTYEIIVVENGKGVFSKSDPATNSTTEVAIIVTQGEMDGKKGILLNMDVVYKKSTVRKISSHIQTLVSAGKEALVDIADNEGKKQMSLKIIATSVL